MTLSLVHVNPATGTSASISATGSVSVGGYVNHSWRGLGACATQGLFTNPWYAEKSKKLLELGLTAEEVIDQIKSDDPEYNKRQCIVLDKQGNASFVNGGENIDYVGARCVPHVAVAGNMLESEFVLKHFLSTFLGCVCMNPIEIQQTNNVPVYKVNYEDTLAESLIEALEAAILVGGDKRGIYSASLRIESFTFAPIDIRVDWKRACIISDLREILSHVRSCEFNQFLKALPKR